MSDLGNKTRLCSEMVVLRGGLQNKKKRAMEVRNKKRTESSIPLGHCEDVV